MIHTETFFFKKYDGKYGKDAKCNDFLHHLQLPKVKRTSVFLKPNSVGRNLKTIFKKSDAPTY